MWQLKLAVFLGAIILAAGVAIGTVIVTRPIEPHMPRRRRKQKDDDESDVRSGYYSALDPNVSLRSDDDVAIGSVIVTRPTEPHMPRRRRKQKDDDESDVRSGYYSALDPSVSLRSEDDDDEYYSAEELEEELDLMIYLQNMDQNLGYDKESLLEENFNKLKEFQEKFPNNCEILWRLARCCHFLSTYFEDHKRKWITEGCKYATESLSIKRTADTLQWFAILEGRRCTFCSISDKLKFAQIFKQNIEEAISLRPRDAFLHYLMANYYYQIVNNVPFLFQKLAESIVGNGTIEDALRHASQAEELSPIPLKQNKLLLAKCLLYKDNKRNKLQVSELLNEASYIEVVTPEDKEAHEEILSMVKNLY